MHRRSQSLRCCFALVLVLACVVLTTSTWVPQLWQAFFTETFLFHTITIDEGHRLKNDTSKLSASLARISAPFRLILTGTPLQNNLNELWALMHYVLPRALEGCSETFAEACCLEAGQLNREVVGQARALLESIMLRRIKADVEKGLLPKIHRTLKVPLSQIQREWYKRVLEKSLEAGGIVSHKQLINQVAQLQKLVNHPKCILIGLDRQREAARSLVRRAGIQHSASQLSLSLNLCRTHVRCMNLCHKDADAARV